MSIRSCQTKQRPHRQVQRLGTIHGCNRCTNHDDNHVNGIGAFQQQPLCPADLRQGRVVYAWFREHCGSDQGTTQASHPGDRLDLLHRFTALMATLSSCPDVHHCPVSLPSTVCQVHLSCAPNFEILGAEETEKCLYIMQVDFVALSLLRHW